MLWDHLLKVLYLQKIPLFCFQQSILKHLHCVTKSYPVSEDGAEHKSKIHLPMTGESRCFMVISIKLISYCKVKHGRRLSGKKGVCGTNWLNCL